MEKEAFVRRDCTLQLPPEITAALNIVCGRDKVTLEVTEEGVIMRRKEVK